VTWASTTTTAQWAPGRWKKEAEQNGQRAFPGQGHPQDEELARLRREVEVLRQEREILKKAISIFSVPRQ